MRTSIEVIHPPPPEPNYKLGIVMENPEELHLLRQVFWVTDTVPEELRKLGVIEASEVELSAA